MRIFDKTFPSWYYKTVIDRQYNGNQKGHTMIYKILHRKQKIEQHEPNKNQVIIVTVVY
jgi:hypothetical protein